METPKYIGPYRVDCRLGAGGMGVVYRAYDAELDRNVAIKCLLPTQEALALQHERFDLEARILARLNHPRIVQVHHTLEHEGTMCIVMEYVDGPTLRQRIATLGPLPVGEVVRLGQQIAEGMAAAHREGIIHRDLKSENVLLDRNGNAKVTDFGVAKVVGDKTLTQNGQGPGTLRTMSPEQLRGKKVTEASDLFSFGVLLYQALAGELPFTGNIQHVVEAIVKLEQPSLSTRIPGLPPKLHGLVGMLLQKHPSLRPSGFGEVIDTLKRIEATLDEGAAALTASSVPAVVSNDESTEDPVQLASNAVEAADAPDAVGMSQALILSPLRGNTSRQLAASESSGPVPVRASRWPRRLAALAGASLIVAALAYALWPTDSKKGHSGPAPDLTRQAPDQQTPAPSHTAELLKSSGRRVAVLAPEVPKDCTHNRKFVASRVRSAMQEPLFYLEGVFVISDMGLGRQDETAEAVGDEVLRATVTCHPDRLDIEIQRQTLDETQPVPPPTSFEIDISDLGRSEAIQANVRLLYQGFATRKDAPARGQAQPADLEKFLRSSEAYWQKQPGVSREQILDEMKAIRKSSPAFLDAYIFAAEMLMHRKDKAALDEAWQIMTEAEQIAGAWPPVLSRLFTIALARGDSHGAEHILDKIAKLDPGSGFTHYLRGLLRKRNHDVHGAREAMKMAAERHPSWRIRYHLAEMEIAACDSEGARRTLDALLTQWPDNRTALALSWMLMGRLDPVAAARSYDALPKPGRSEIVNQAINLMNTQKYGDAIALLRQALAQHEGNVAILYSLAEAEKLARENQSAEAHFAQVLAQVPADEHDADSMAARAMVLAHQGNTTEARQAIERALRRNDMEIFYYAAAVYALIGDHAAAIDQAERALDCGYAREWFHYPWFDAISESPRLRRRIGRDSAVPARQ